MSLIDRKWLSAGKTTVSEVMESGRDFCSLTECLPIKSLNELLCWSGRPMPQCCTHPFQGCLKQGRRTLVCHDMMGGYLQDSKLQGCSTKDCYQFYQWQYTDIFVYFSHHLITVPPVGWVNAAHKNHVPVLGTFITEWDDGAETCKQLLKSEQSFKDVADKLVDIACYVGFDGWLINIENKIDIDCTDNLVNFVEYLSQAMHSRKSNSLVLWYDSVITTTGELKWQNELNNLNRRFFDVCDGIFLNYTWKEENLKQSASLAQSHDRLHDVYVGIDVFGRGMVGGGGFNTKLAVEAAQTHDLSLAIFAPGWVYETQDKLKFEESNNRFWLCLQSYCLSTKSKSLPLVTSFSAGFGDKFFHLGKQVSETPWSNLNLQQLQPDIAACLDDTDNSVNTVELCSSIVYSGGHSVQLFGKYDERRMLKYRLFNLDVPDPKESLFVCLKYIIKSHTNVSFNLETEGGVEIFLTDGDDSVQKEYMGEKKIVLRPCSEDVPELIKECDSLSDPGWTSRYYIIPEEHTSHAGKLTNLSIICTPTHENSNQCELYIGQIQILRQQDIPTSIPVVCDLKISELQCLPPAPSDENTKVNDTHNINCRHMLLEWTYPDNIADHFLIWQLVKSDLGGVEYRYIGSAFCCMYVVTCELDDGICEQVEYCVVPVHKSGAVQQIQCGAKVATKL